MSPSEYLNRLLSTVRLRFYPSIERMEEGRRGEREKNEKEIGEKVREKTPEKERGR